MLSKSIIVLLVTMAYNVQANAEDAVKPDGQWRGFVNAGASFASGNTTSRSGNLAAEGTKNTERNKLHHYLSALYGVQRDSNGENRQTANQIRGGTKYDHDINPRLFSFASLDLEHDKLQRLNLRSVLAAGFGRHFIKTTETTFDMFAGLTYNRESFVDDTRNSIELLLGEESTHKISETASFKQRLAVYPNVKESGEYRVQFDAGLNLTVTEKVGMQLTFSDRYQSNPQPGIKKNDALLLASVSYKFGPK